MRLNAVFALAAALALAGCVTPETVPARTGSVRPAVSARGATNRAGAANRAGAPKTALPDAILACLNRGVKGMTPEFQNCVAHARRASVPPAGGPRDRVRTVADNRG